jgi:hypothetical protein
MDCSKLLLPLFGRPITKFVLCVFRYANTSYLSSLSESDPSTTIGVCFNGARASFLLLYSYLIYKYIYCVLLKNLINLYDLILAGSDYVPLGRRTR